MRRLFLFDLPAEIRLFTEFIMQLIKYIFYVYLVKSHNDDLSSKSLAFST